MINTKDFRLLWISSGTFFFTFCLFFNVYTCKSLLRFDQLLIPFIINNVRGLSMRLTENFTTDSLWRLFKKSFWSVFLLLLLTSLLGILTCFIAVSVVTLNTLSLFSGNFLIKLGIFRFLRNFCGAVNKKRSR